jgi:hypothetical protein
VIALDPEARSVKIFKILLKGMMFEIRRSQALMTTDTNIE